MDMKNLERKNIRDGSSKLSSRLSILSTLWSFTLWVLTFCNLLCPWTARRCKKKKGTSEKFSGTHSVVTHLHHLQRSCTKSRATVNGITMREWSPKKRCYLCYFSLAFFGFLFFILLLLSPLLPALGFGEGTWMQNIHKQDLSCC